MPRVASPDKLQLLGVAFASADLAFEVGRDGIITFAIGAARQIVGIEAHALVGWDWRAFVETEDVGTVGLILSDLASGERRGSIRLRCVSAADDHMVTEGELSVFRLPGRNAHISCAFRRSESAGLRSHPKGTGLLDRLAFEDLTAAVIDEANEHPASRSGISTVRSGARIFALSAMKWTPHSTINSLSQSAAACASASESPVTSATPWKISGDW